MEILMSEKHNVNVNVNVNVNKFALLCFLFASSAFPQSVISQIKWTGAGSGVVIGVAVFFGAGLGLMIALYLGYSRRHAKDRQEGSEKLFGEGCKRTQLTAEEGRVLRMVAACAPGATRAHEIFGSIAVFERSMDVYVNRAIRAQRAEGQEEVLRNLRRKLGFNFLPTEQPLISTRNLCVGQGVSVYKPGQNSHPAGGEVTRVGEVYFTVRIADGFREGLDVEGGAELTVMFLRQGDAAYSAVVRVERPMGASGEISFYHTVKFSRSQNRRYMRLDAVLPLKYKVVEKANPEQKPGDETYQARSADISGGGLCFLASEPLDAGDVIQLHIQLPGQPLGGINSKILKVIPVAGKAPAQYKHLTQFVSIEPPQRERIVKFIFEKQREAIQMR
jgi:c-di-GMP-binding flagellar brake protein YcgR